MAYLDILDPGFGLLLNQAVDPVQQDWAVSFTFPEKGLDLLQVTDDGRAVVHAEKAKFAQLLHRAESLIHIAQHYYAAGDMQLTYLFAQRACELPTPEFAYCDEDIKNLYTYARYDLLGIAAWYVQEFEIGENALKIALTFYPDDARLKSNLQFYLDRKKS